MGSDALVVAPSAPGGPGADEMGRIVKLVPDTDKVEKHVLRRVELCQRLGKGAYGVVWKAIEKRTRRVIALKKCYDAFRGATDAQRTYREVMYLTLLAGHDNLVHLTHVLKADNDHDLYLTFDYMDADLHSVVRSNVLLPIHKKYIMYQLVKALKYIHSAELIHRDVKPSNILLSSQCALKLCDFGLMRSLAEPEGPSPVLTDYVATRWYRPPEVLLGSTHYATSFDMWSAGCVLGEMLIGQPMFHGTSTMNQVEKILEVSGRPNATDVIALHSPYAATMLEATPPTRPLAIAELCTGAPTEAIDLITQCITFNPSRRPDAEQALRHPFLAEFHDPDDEPGYEGGPVVLDINDNTRLAPNEYREALYAEVMRRKAALRKSEVLKMKTPGSTILQEAEGDKLGS